MLKMLYNDHVLNHSIITFTTKMDVSKGCANKLIVEGDHISLPLKPCQRQESNFESLGSKQKQENYFNARAHCQV